MREWVDEIKSIGNDANHELTPILADQANDVATFTEQLLVLAYEMRALRGRHGQVQQGEEALCSSESSAEPSDGDL